MISRIHDEKCMTGPSCPWPHASVAGAMRAISRVSHTFAWRGHDVHRHRIMGMTLPSCLRHHAPTIHRSHMSVLRKKSGSGASIGSRKSGGIGAVGEVPRSQTREQTPRKLNPTRTITNVERCPIARSAPQRNRDSAPPAQDTAGAPPQDLDAPARQPTPRTG